MIRRQRTEARGQTVVCCYAVCAARLCGSAATKPLSSAICPPSSERGFSLVSAIFLLVVIAALATFAVTLSTTQQQGAALDVQGARAYQAARAGIEWGAYKVMITPAAIACGTLAAPVANAVTLTGTTLPGFTVTVTCGSAATTEASTPVTVYQLTSTATQGTVVAPNYVERQMTVSIAK